MAGCVCPYDVLLRALAASADDELVPTRSPGLFTLPSVHAGLRCHFDSIPTGGRCAQLRQMQLRCQRQTESVLGQAQTARRIGSPGFSGNLAMRERAALPILCTSRRLVTGASFGGTGRGNLERIFEQKSGDLQRILPGGGLSRRSICRTLVKSCYQHPGFSILS